MEPEGSILFHETPTGHLPKLHQHPDTPFTIHLNVILSGEPVSTLHACFVAVAYLYSKKN
jgi:hypothetical protein